MKIHNVEQNSPEWFKLRNLKMTASNAAAIAAAGKGLETYIKKMFSEAYSSAERENYSNEHTERGHELEVLAVNAYEMQNNVILEKVGFCEIDEHVGCSPDRFIKDSDGIVEIKCPCDKVYMDYLLEGLDKGISSYEWQVQFQMYVTNKKLADLVIYNPNFEKELLIKRIYRDEVKIEKIKLGLEKGKEIIKKYNNILTK